jgi:hypothetical protein
MQTLTLGPIAIDEHTVWRSDLRWELPTGAQCKAGQVLAYCNITIQRRGQREVSKIFTGEKRDTQIALLAPQAGRLRQCKTLSRGGFHDFFAMTVWTDEAFAVIETPTDAPDTNRPADLVLLAGQRITEMAEVRSGLLTGWHERARASRIGTQAVGTLLAAGICDMDSALRGPSRAMVEFVTAAPKPVQLISLPDTCLVPCARVLFEQLSRSVQQNAAISADMMQGLINSPMPLQPKDLIFAGTLLGSMTKSPLTETVDTITYTGIHQTKRPDALLISIKSENARMFRHRRLGYTLAFHGYRLKEAGVAFHHWLKLNFEQVARNPQTIAHDYQTLIQALQTQLPKLQLMVANASSTPSDDDHHNYMGMDAQTMGSIVNVRARSQNTMLLQLARAHGFAVVDLDAVVARLGSHQHLIDAVHGDATLEAATRAEVLATAARLAVPGF